MKTIKPSKISVLARPFELHRKTYFSVALLVLSDLDEPAGFHAEAELWNLSARELGAGAILDESMPKQRGEVLVSGRCYAPGGAPQQGGSVRVKIASVDKTLYVFGDRTWGWHGAMSYPEPFAVMPVSWAHAFGGEGCAANPLGKGMPPGKGGEVHRLPNVEDPRRLLHTRGDRPVPAGLDGYHPTWPQRWSKIGTYDATWLKEHAPGLAPDVDLSMFNVAPEDQQIEGFFRGDEPFLIENMHPDRPRLEGRLPAIAARCFLTRAGAADTGAGALEEVPTRLDTVRFFPDQGRVMLAFRGLVTIAEDDAADVLELVAALEDLGAPRPVEHYEDVRRRRLDKRRGALHALRDADLVPDRAVTRKKDRRPDPRDPEALVQTEGLLRKHLAARARQESERLGQALGVNDLDRDAETPEVEDLASFVDRAEAMAEEQKKASEQQRATAETRARETFAGSGVDYDKAVAEARRETSGPPKFSAEKELTRLRDIQEMARNGGVASPELDAALADPALRERLEKAERDLRETYRKHAHYLPAAARLEGDARSLVRERVAKAYAGGESFVGHDLTGADLSGMDLAFANFQGALLESADLRDAKLTEADFTGALLARADLSGADLAKARLEGANLGEARLVSAKLGEGADLRGAVLSKADLEGADLRRARLGKADLLEAKLAGVDLREAEMPEALLLRNDLHGARLGAADLSHACFIEVDLRGADLTSAKLDGTTFVHVRADGAVLVSASIENARIVGESSLAGADLRGARASRTNFRGVNLAGADLSGATANSSDFSSCDLRGAKLYRLVARGARFVRADLTDASLVGADLLDAILEKAKLAGADFKGSNLFRADFARAEGDARTSFERANVKRVRFLPRRD